MNKIMAEYIQRMGEGKWELCIYTSVCVCVCVYGLLILTVK